MNTCIEPDMDLDSEEIGLLSRGIVRATRTLALASDGRSGVYIDPEQVRTSLVHLRYVARNVGVDVY